MKRNLRILHVILCSCTATALLLSAWACCRAARKEAPEADAEKAPEPKPVGKCREPDHIKGTCTFLAVNELSENDPLKPAGKSAFRVSYSLKAEDGSITGVSVYLAAAMTDGEKLRDYYKEHSPAACELHKLYPPCAPVGEATELKLDPPDFAELIDPLRP